VMSPGRVNIAPAGGTPAPGSEAPISLTGRAVTLRIEVRDDQGAALRRTAIVEFTGAPTRPFVVRGLD